MIIIGARYYVVLIKVTMIAIIFKSYDDSKSLSSSSSSSEVYIIIGSS